MSFAFRVVTSIIGPDLALELHFSGGDLGHLTSTCLLSFGLMQLPRGAWLDRFPAAVLNSLLLFFCRVGRPGLCFERFAHRAVDWPLPDRQRRVRLSDVGVLRLCQQVIARTAGASEVVDAGDRRERRAGRDGARGGFCGVTQCSKSSRTPLYAPVSGRPH
jgi:hypothetical protein